MFKFIVSITLLFIACSTDAYAALSLAELEALVESNHAAHQESLDHMWTMIAAALVLFMQGGFLLLEAGMVRSKNSINVAQKNIIDFLLAVVVFYVFGFAVMFGATNGGWFGWSSDLALFQNADDWNYTFFVFQAVFAGTAGTIVSGAVAERMKLSGYIWITLLIAVVIYPVVGHWAWGNLLNGDNTSYLIDNGFIDFAGSTVVHSVGAWVALAACIVLGPRIGRYSVTGKVQRMEGHSLVLSTLGCIILWVGWIGFNGGSTTVGSSDFAHIVFNTMIASVFGGTVALIAGRLDDGFFRPDQAINGILAGLVAITAGCDAVDAWGAAIIGSTAGIVMHFSWIMLVRTFKVDDVVGAIPVHGICGAWGTIMVAFCATEEKLGGATVMEQFSIQAQGVLMVFAWAFGITYVFCKILHSMVGIRVSVNDELEGLNISEHQSTLGTGMLQQCLKEVVDGTRDLTKRVDVEVGDESAEVAAYINQFLGQMQELMHGIHEESAALEGHSDKMSEISTIMAASSEEMSAQSASVTGLNKQMADDASNVSGLVDAMKKHIGDVSGSAVHMSENMEYVSKAIVDLTTSITDIAQKSDSASKTTTEANALTVKASQTVDTLSNAAGEIGAVIDDIKQIASQTNLLALNATIEASRAGDAGRGFAVVASEVKQLAGETTKATEAIEQRVSNIKVSSVDVAEIIAEVTSFIGIINDVVSNISKTTTAQNEAAGDISSNVSQATEDTKHVTESLGEILGSAETISQSAHKAVENAKSIHESMEDFTKESFRSSTHAIRTQASSRDVKDVSSNLTSSVGKYKIKPVDEA